MKLTLFVFNEPQKKQLNTGQKLNGEPLLKVDIEGIASQSVALETGAYMLALLSREPVPVEIAYRATYREY